MFHSFRLRPLKPRPNHNLRCRVEGCSKPARLHAYVIDVEPLSRQRDRCVPQMCAGHAAENELGSKGLPQPRSDSTYPHTKRCGQSEGWTAYAVISTGRWLNGEDGLFGIKEQLEALARDEAGEEGPSK